VAALVRPDNYVYGVAGAAEEMEVLVEEVEMRLGLTMAWAA
jgi:hypothetical protein